MAAALCKVALVRGSGKLGAHILKALHTGSRFDATVITRCSSTAVFPSGTRIRNVKDDYPEDEVVEAFEGYRAVVLCLSFTGEHFHTSLVDSSLKAGVKHLVALALGGNDQNEKGAQLFPISARQAKMIEGLKAKEQSGWSWTAICCGLFFGLYVLGLARWLVQLF